MVKAEDKLEDLFETFEEASPTNVQRKGGQDAFEQFYREKILEALRKYMEQLIVVHMMPKVRIVCNPKTQLIKSYAILIRAMQMEDPMRFARTVDDPDMLYEEYTQFTKMDAFGCYVIALFLLFKTYEASLNKVHLSTHVWKEYCDLFWTEMWQDESDTTLSHFHAFIQEHQENLEQLLIDVDEMKKDMLRKFAMEFHALRLHTDGSVKFKIANQPHEYSLETAFQTIVQYHHQGPHADAIRAIQKEIHRKEAQIQTRVTTNASTAFSLRLLHAIVKHHAFDGIRYI